ncbi:unnamed protein product [Adineta steineri]|uniref:Uncharacterized protein n=1 Tax=Adineta steineri TaxID=433720 RepID=A0A815QXU5_9BILA|nr:unnamed protein product [Adineta steineri]
MGTFSGLSFGIKLLAPFIAKIILRRKNRVLPVENVAQIQVSWQHRFNTIRGRIRLVPQSIKEKAVSLNLFESSKPRTPTNIYREQLLTRFFIVLIIVSSIGVGFYVFLIKQNQLITTTHPSLTTYQQLYNDHPTTLQCPCSNISVPYEAFLNVTFTLHQVCSSDLISPAWLHYLVLFDPTLLSEWPFDSWSTRDFRIMGASYFQLLAAFCSMAKINIDDAQRVFNNTKFINDRVLAPSFFLQKTQAIIDSFINTTRNNFVRTFNWIHVALIFSQYFNGGNINFHITLTSDDQLSIKSTNYQIYSVFAEGNFASNDLCKCSVNYNVCFLIPLLYINASYSGKFPITSFFKMVDIGCTPLTGFRNSKIGWWYISTYLEYIKETYSIVIKSQPPPSIKSLNASILTRFENERMLKLIDEMLLETIISNNTHFDQFYNECLPRSCTYTNKQRRGILASLLLLIAICGGLNKIFRILIPLFGKLIFSCIDWWKRRHTRRIISISGYVKHLLITTYQSIKTLNLFKTEPTEEILIRQQQIYTRVYLVLYISSLSILLFYTALVNLNIDKRYYLSSIMDYEEFLKDHPSDDITCPCTHISIPYDNFINELQVNAFHEACTTDAIHKILRYGLQDINDYELHNVNNFKVWKFIFIDFLQFLCSLAQESVNNSTNVFLSSTMLINQLESRERFENEINDTINQFQKRIPISFTQTLDLIRMTTQGNALLAMFSSNWNTSRAGTDTERNSSFVTIPIIHNNTEQNTSCSCATLQTCTVPAHLSSSNETMIIDGMVFGCYLLETVLLSSLSCFYSETCITNVRNLLGALPPTPQQLNNSLTRFSVNDTIETMAYQMFIESWTSNVSYENFYESCSPNYCVYTYRSRFDVTEMLTTFLSVFAGLSFGIRFVVPYLVKIFQKIKRRFCIEPTQ